MSARDTIHLAIAAINNSIYLKFLKRCDITTSAAKFHMLGQKEYRIGAYNAFKGGYKDYSPTAERTRFKALVTAITYLHPDALGVSDSNGWDRDFTPHELASAFDFKDSASVPLLDPRLQELGHDNGVSLLTNFEIVEARPVQLVTRQALLATVKVDKKLLDIAVVYFDDIHESLREDQAEALVQALSLDRPTLIMGDLNTFNAKDFRFTRYVGSYLRRSFPRIAATFLPQIRERVKGNTLRYLESQSFVDAGETNPQPTTPTPLLKVRPLPGGVIEVPLMPLFRLDYILYRGGIIVSPVKRHSGGIFDRASDHYPITAQLKINETSSGLIYPAE
ncbi:hypothetical protein A2Z00_03655 [Candidatus Gottesmanbacteria bacterium RBG_13_45_10]|uniref:Endonuclease/exonuclease/phosphatase domain-containing protein n=1 Tax=Candidatus Gottesmanbacteria bacterium RBG_13_45_10 TaxID=1798370 RepID=A0A1F5ZHC9_9BACT|nr:MAG: hypothetical protein A2Z00_03655 [Candidatus Gottesmanbacteria bacterium RBG_13_45_10]